MDSPKPHNLTTYDSGFSFKKYGFCSHQWEISVPQKNCIIWGVVLSYLRSADFTVPGKFEERLNQLTENKVDPETAKSAILDFNPFFNIHKCFFDETLQKISQCFKKILNEKRPSAASKSVPQDIQIISMLLKSNILIIDFNERKLHLVMPSNNYCADAAAITLICREYPSKESMKQGMMKRFTFSLSKDLCWELRRNAFQILLESPDIKRIAESVIQALPEKKEKNVNLLIALLKENLTSEITDMYDSSYTMSKLADAGFETDPTVLDSDGFSAFYYALQSNDNNLVYILHRYKANSSKKFENTFRDPNACIVSNFLKLKEILDGDRTLSNNFEKLGERAEQARFRSKDLQTFNRFLTLVSQGINDIRDRTEGNSMDKASKQKDIILHILDTYTDFFFIEQVGSPLENYTKHKTYYDNMDITVALLFFDNIFLLKSILKSPKESLYSKLESSFLLSAITNKYFISDAKNSKKLKDLGFELTSIDLSIIPLLERLNLREQVTNFSRILREKILFEEDIVECIPQQEIVEMLNDFSELKDEFLIFRLDHYLKAALESMTKDPKQKFAIQRALQVIGESINIEGENPSSIKHLLRKCLPEGSVAVLKTTRNILSHLKSFQFPFKFEAEQDNCLFESIRFEIQNIKDSLKEIFDIQKIRLMEFLINRGLESVQKFQQDIDIAFHTLVQPMENFGIVLRKKSSEFKGIPHEKSPCEHRPSLPAIDEFCRNLKGLASIVLKKRIREEIPSEVTTRVDGIKKLEEDLEEGISVNLERFDNLFMKKKCLDRIKSDYKKYLELKEESEADAREKVKCKNSLLYRIKKSPNPLNILDQIFNKKKVSDSHLEFLYDVIHFPNETKSALNSLIKISNCPCGDSLANLVNRVKILSEISIDEQYDIRFLWERVKSPKAKQYLVYKIVQRYFRESSFHACLEMLLFDCFVILKNNEDFKSFWLKNSYLFNGIDVRNVLAHGDPLLESIGGLLDPKDLPSELVKKMLQLIEDLDCIEALCDLWKKAKGSGEIADNCPDCFKLKKRILCCVRWQDYSKLLAEDPMHSEICNVLVSFLKKEQKSKKK